MQLVVGRVAKSHGLGGEVAVDVRTDSPAERFAPEASIDTDPADRGPLRVTSTRWHAGRLLVRFEGIHDRTEADGLRGLLLVADSSTSPAPPDEDDFWDHDLVGLTAVLSDGTPVGEVLDVIHPGGSDLLVVDRGDADDALVPFVRDIVAAVDLAARRVVLTPPEGLLEL